MNRTCCLRSRVELVRRPTYTTRYQTEQELYATENRPPRRTTIIRRVREPTIVEGNIHRLYMIFVVERTLLFFIQVRR
jgi:hypothetical protein